MPTALPFQPANLLAIIPFAHTPPSAFVCSEVLNLVGYLIVSHGIGR